MFVVGTAVTALGLHTLGSAFAAEGTPYGFAFVVGGIWTVLGVTVVLLTCRAAAAAAGSPVLPATGAGVVCVLALTAGLLGLPVDDTTVGPECLTGSGALVDCDDPRIDTDAERATARPRGGPPPEPAPDATPVG